MPTPLPLPIPSLSSRDITKLTYEPSSNLLSAQWTSCTLLASLSLQVPLRPPSLTSGRWFGTTSRLWLSCSLEFRRMAKWACCIDQETWTIVFHCSYVRTVHVPWCVVVGCSVSLCSLESERLKYCFLPASYQRNNFICVVCIKLSSFNNNSEWHLLFISAK